MYYTCKDEGIRSKAGLQDVTQGLYFTRLTIPDYIKVADDPERISHLATLYERMCLYPSPSPLQAL